MGASGLAGIERYSRPPWNRADAASGLGDRAASPGSIASLPRLIGPGIVRRCPSAWHKCEARHLQINLQFSLLRLADACILQAWPNSPLVKKCIQSITASAAKDDAAFTSAVVLAKAAKGQEATEVARMITSTARRDEALAKIAKGD
jgi:hypothetical protein